MAVAGLLLTGGRSSRLGADKADLRMGNGGTLSARTAGLLGTVAEPVIEVGPGRTALRAVADSGEGPLAAVAAGATALRSGSGLTAALVVATDLPLLTAGLLSWLAAHPAPGSVVPVAAGRSQPLCARYSAADLDVAVAIVGAGRRSMRDLLDAIEPVYVDEDEWVPAAGDPSALQDVDTPADLVRLLGSSS
jgi:molybdenum cofactor guanylyltransferase